MISAPTSDTVAYITASGSIAVYLTIDDAGGAIVATASDPWSPSAPGGGRVEALAWAWGRKNAEACADTIRAALPPGCAPDEAVAAFEEAAAAAKAVPHERVLAIAEHAVQSIGEKFDAMMRSGDLRELNRSYKALRLSGVKLPPYGRFRLEYRGHMIREAARMAEARASAGVWR